MQTPHVPCIPLVVGLLCPLPRLQMQDYKGRNGEPEISAAAERGLRERQGRH